MSWVMGQRSRPAERLTVVIISSRAVPQNGVTVVIISSRAVSRNVFHFGLFEGFLSGMDGDSDHAFDAHEDGIFIGALLSVEEIGYGHHGSGAYVV